jgi:gluconokinase
VTIVGDGAANNIGAGCSTKAEIALMVGTSGAMRVVFAGEPPEKLSPRLWCYRASRERVIIGGALSDGGGLVQWLIQTLNLNRDELNMEIEMLKPDVHGLTVLPFWSGERSTGWLADSRGGIFGLRLRTKPAEIARAVLESIAYRFALIARGLEEIAPGATMVASGNALRSFPAWLQIISDVLNRPLLLTDTAEASSRGAALLALESAGKIATSEDIKFGVHRRVLPDEARHERYQRGLARQEKLYQQLKKETK